MKYSTEVIINKPLEEVVKLFDSSENLKKWQPELVSFEHVSGEPGEKGAVSKMKFLMGKREVEMTETIIKRELPTHFDALYEAKKVKNWNCNNFEVIDDNTTKWTQNNEFKFGGFVRVMAFFMPGMFKRQTCTHMDRFKAFAENDPTTNS